MITVIIKENKFRLTLKSQKLLKSSFIAFQQLTAAAQAAAAQASQPQDLGLARLGALGALADLADGAVGGGDLLNEVPSTINYEDLVIGNQAASHTGKVHMI